MAAYSGPQHRGARRARRARLREEAEARQAVTLHGRRRRDRNPDRADRLPTHLTAGQVHVRPVDDAGAPVGPWSHVGYLTSFGFTLAPEVDEWAGVTFRAEERIALTVNHPDTARRIVTVDA